MHKIEVENKILSISHANKVLFPQAKFTKIDLVNYYLKISDYILPYVKYRPIILFNVFQKVSSRKAFIDNMHLIPFLIGLKRSH